MTVDAGHDVIERRQHIVVEIQAAVGENVALGALEDFDALQTLIDRVDFRLLLPHALGSEAVGHGQRLRMVAEAEVFQAELFRGQRHLLDAVAAVAVGRVAVEHALDVVRLDEVGQVAVGGRVHLAGVFAQFRRDVGQVERLEKVRLVAALDAMIGTGQFVLVEFQPVFLSAHAHGDVVFLAAGEVVQREGELLVA